MDKQGKYTIGVRVVNKDKRQVDGLYVLGKYALPWICENVDKIRPDEDCVYVIDDAETAQKVVRFLARNYRYEYRERAKRLGVDQNAFGVYAKRWTAKEFDGLKIGAPIAYRSRYWDSIPRDKFRVCRVEK